MTAIDDQSETMERRGRQGSGAQFTLFAGSFQEASQVLLAKTLLIHLESNTARTVFLEFSRPYAKIYDLIRQAMRMDHCNIFFETINDARYLPLIEALLSRNFTVWGGVEAYSREEALRNLGELSCAGLNHKTGLFTSTQTSRMASLALRNINKMFGGIEVIELQSSGVALSPALTRPFSAVPPLKVKVQPHGAANQLRGSVIPP